MMQIMMVVSKFPRLLQTSFRASPTHFRQRVSQHSLLGRQTGCTVTRYFASKARSRIANPVIRKLPPVVTPELTAADLADEQESEERPLAGKMWPGKHPLASILIEEPAAIGYAPWRPGMPDRWQWPLYGASELPQVPPAAAAFASKLFRSGAQYVGDETDFCVPGVAIPSWTELPVLGRSNVGKSSLLNALLGSDDAAFVPVSSTPGSTRHLDFYAVGNATAQGKLSEAQLLACGMDGGDVVARGAAAAGTAAAAAALASGAALDNVTLASLLTAEEVREELIASAPLGGAAPRKPASVAGGAGGRKGGAAAGRDGRDGRADGGAGAGGKSGSRGRRSEKEEQEARKAERHAAAMASMQAQYGRPTAAAAASAGYNFDSVRGPPHGHAGGVSLSGSSAAALAIHHDTSTLSAVARARSRADLVLVDTPGYGYNAAGLGAGAGWARLIRSYLKFRTGLQATLPRALLLIDARVGITPLDAEVLRMLDDQQVPYHMVLTKADALSRVELESRVDAVARAASELALPYPVVNAVSAHTGAGLAELMGQLMLSTKLSRRLHLHGDKGGNDSRF